MTAQGKQLSLFGMEDEPEEVDEKTQLLRDDLGRGSGFVNGKLRIAEYYEQHQPTDKEFAVFLEKEYGIGGHSGPDMPNVGYDSKGIHIISADKKGNYRYTWAQAAKEIRRMIEQGEYILPTDIRDAVDHTFKRWLPAKASSILSKGYARIIFLGCIRLSYGNRFTIYRRR